MKRLEAALDWDRMLVTLPELSKIFRVSESMVMKYARESDMPKGSTKGRYPLLACLWWREDRLAKSVDSESKDILEERRKLIVSQRIGQELENAKTREELLDSDLVGTAIQHMGALIATQLDGLAPRLTPLLMQVRDPAQITRLITDECRTIRGAASGAVAHFASSLVAGDDSEASPPEKRRGVGRRQPDPTAGQPGAGAVAN